MRYYKKDIALEQIKTSIELFFEWKNNISAQTLIHATKILLEDLDRKKWTDLRLESYLKEDITKEERSNFFDSINEFPNFCKHSKNDPKDYIDTKIKLIRANEYQIFYCIQLYHAVFNEKIKDSYIISYLYYLSINWRYNFILKKLFQIEPEIMREIKNWNKEVWITKKNPNLKKEFYKLIIHYKS